jgi:hypothetical protein
MEFIKRIEHLHGKRVVVVASKFNGNFQELAEFLWREDPSLSCFSYERVTGTLSLVPVFRARMEDCEERSVFIRVKTEYQGKCFERIKIVSPLWAKL